MKSWKDFVFVILACAFVFLVIFGATLLKVEAYDGDMSCLFIKCVRIIK